MSGETRAAGDRRTGRGAGQAGRAGRGLRRSRPRDRASGCTRARSSSSVGPERGHRHPGDPRRSHRLRLRAACSTKPASPRCSPRPVTTSPSARPTSGPAWPSPTVCAVPDLDLWRDDLASFPTEQKIELAKELERLTLARDPRCGSSERTTPMPWARRPSPPPPACGPRAGRTAATWSVSTLADDGDETQTGLRLLRRAARPASSTSPRPRARAPSGPLGCSARVKPASRRLTVVFDPYVTAQFLGVLSGDAERRVGAEGPVAVRQPRRRAGGVAAGHARRRPDQPAGLLGVTGRRRGAGDAPQRADRRRCAAGLRAVVLQRASQRHRLDRQRRAGLQVDAVLRGAGSPAGARDPAAGRPRRRRSTTAC